MSTGVLSPDGGRGWDLGPLIVGSEGTLAIVTRVALRLSSLPGGFATYWAEFQTLEAAASAVASITAAGFPASVLEILDREGITLPRIQEVIAGMGPLPGAADFLRWRKSRAQVVILSDTFYQFAHPLMRQLDFPCLFCHRLEVEEGGRISGYQLRIDDGKRRAVSALRQLAFRVVAAGDSYNDTRMLSEADAGILFKPPQNVIDDFPQFEVTNDYGELRSAFVRQSDGEIPEEPRLSLD